MHENRFSTAGWVSIAAAVIFPLAFIIEGIHEVVLELGDTDIPVGIGPADFLFLLFAALSVYVFKTFKSLMFESYSFKEIGTIININIFWHLVFFGGSFVIELLLGTVWPQNDLGLPLVLLVFWVMGIAVFGIIDLIIGIILLRQRHRFRMPVKVFAYFSIAVGFFEATVILSPLTLVLVPASFVAMAFVLLQKVEDLEFV